MGLTFYWTGLLDHVYRSKGSVDDFDREFVGLDLYVLGTPPHQGKRLGCALGNGEL